MFFLEHGVHPGHALGGRYGFLPFHARQCNTAGARDAKQMRPSLKS